MRENGTNNGDEQAIGVFSFVSINHPSSATNAAVRRRIRSHVSSFQHRQKRKCLRDTKLGISSDVPLTRKELDQKQAATGTRTEDETSGSGPVYQPSTKKLHSENAALAQHQNFVNQSPISALEVSFSRGEMSFRTFALLDSDNIVGASVGALGFDVAEVMSFYKMVVQVEARDFGQYYQEVIRNPVVPIWRRFWNFVFTEPVLLTIAILAIAHYKIDTLDRTTRDRDLYHIRSIETFLLGAINQALGDPVRGISDQMLIAVTLIAAYEIKHGNSEHYHIHARGLVKMIDMRGGLSAIGQSDPYVEQLLLFQDAKTAILAGNEGYLKFLPNSMRQYPARPPYYMQTVGARVLSQTSKRYLQGQASDGTAWTVVQK